MTHPEGTSPIQREWGGEISEPPPLSPHTTRTGSGLASPAQPPASRLTTVKEESQPPSFDRGQADLPPDSVWPPRDIR